MLGVVVAFILTSLLLPTLLPLIRGHRYRKPNKLSFLPQDVRSERLWIVAQRGMHGNTGTQSRRPSILPRCGCEGKHGQDSGLLSVAGNPTETAMTIRQDSPAPGIPQCRSSRQTPGATRPRSPASTNSAEPVRTKRTLLRGLYSKDRIPGHSSPWTRPMRSRSSQV